MCSLGDWHSASPEGTRKRSPAPSISGSLTRTYRSTCSAFAHRSIVRNRTQNPIITYLSPSKRHIFTVVWVYSDVFGKDFRQQTYPSQRRQESCAVCRSTYVATELKINDIAKHDDCYSVFIWMLLASFCTRTYNSPC